MFRSNGSINYLRSLLGLGGKKKPASKPGKMFQNVFPKLDALEDRFAPAALVYVDDNWTTLANGTSVPIPGQPNATIGTDAFGSIGASTTAVVNTGGINAV